MWAITVLGCSQTSAVSLRIDRAKNVPHASYQDSVLSRSIVLGYKARVDMFTRQPLTQIHCGRIKEVLGSEQPVF